MLSFEVVILCEVIVRGFVGYFAAVIDYVNRWAVWCRFGTYMQTLIVCIALPICDGHIDSLLRWLPGEVSGDFCQGSGLQRAGHSPAKQYPETPASSHLKHDSICP